MDKKRFTLRINPELRPKVEDEAKILGLSQNDYINLAILKMDVKKIAGSKAVNSVK